LLETKDGLTAFILLLVVCCFVKLEFYCQSAQRGQQQLWKTQGNLFLHVVICSQYCSWHEILEQGVPNVGVKPRNLITTGEWQPCLCLRVRRFLDMRMNGC